MLILIKIKINKKKSQGLPFLFLYLFHCTRRTNKPNKRSKTKQTNKAITAKYVIPSSEIAKAKTCERAQHILPNDWKESIVALMFESMR